MTTRFTAVAVSLLGLASAMGIGRFAFTPLLPLMQASDGISVAQGGTLAAVNYVGYLVGALACVAVRTSLGALARIGLVAVALSTVAMGTTTSFAGWLGWRFAAGVASALVLVGVTSWSLGALARAGRPASAGGVFAGVGIGIAFAGLVSLAAALQGKTPNVAWVLLGSVAAIIAALCWRPLSAAAPASTEAASSRPLDAESWRLIACYGVVGFGYILPATFLPAVARGLLPDPAQFGLIWPLFGAAAAISAVVASRRLANDARPLWAASQLVMALGVLAAVSGGGAGLVISAVCVGSTFVVITMAALQVAREVAGAASPRLAAAMTAAFATGQLLGPLVVSAAASNGGAPPAPYLFAAAALAAATLLLRRSRVAATTERSSS